MRKIGTIFIIGLVLVGFAFAGGIVTNTNNSADWVRLMNRNASTDVDAVYFNPAGLTYLNDGLSFYLSSQTIYQTRTITSDVQTLNSDTFEGTTFAPVFPNFYVAYKMGDFAFGAGFVPIGGGGSAVFDDGLPSFAVPASLLPAGLTGQGIPTSNYDFDIAFDGSSIYMGGQAVVSYKINDMISVAGGARYFSAKNTYVGHLKDIMIDPTVPGIANGTLTSAPEFFATMAGVLSAGADGATAGAASLQPFIDGGAGNYTFETLVAYGIATQAIVDGVATGFGQLGIPFDPTTMTPVIAQQYALGAAASYTENSAAMAAYVDQVQDIVVDTEQTGSGFAPILGLYLSWEEGLDLALRYEGKAAMTLTNATKEDGSGLFPDGAKTHADMPAMIGAGLGYKVMPSLRIVADLNYYFNEDVNWDGKEKFLENGVEFGAGLDFAVSEDLQLSAGYLNSQGGALHGYGNDLSHSLNAYTIGAGGRYYINPNLYLSFGVSSTTYENLENDGVSYRGLITGNETYDKTAIDFAIGIGFSR